jgi:hypothetical protein
LEIIVIVSIRAFEKINGENFKTPAFTISDDGMATAEGRSLAMENFNELARKHFDRVRQPQDAVWPPAVDKELAHACGD